MECKKCPIAKKCESKKKRVIKIYSEDVKEQLEKALKNFCPLEVVIQEIEGYVEEYIEQLPYIKALQSMKKDIWSPHVRELLTGIITEEKRSDEDM